MKGAGVYLVAFVLVLVLVLVPVCLVPSARADEGGCVNVSGSIAATVIALESPTVLGTVRGDLQGAVEAVITSELPLPEGGTFTLEHTFLTDARELLRTTDKATWVKVDDGVFHMSTVYSVQGGTGKFANATGTLTNHGEADVNTGQITLGYEGRICGVTQKKE